MKFRDVPQIGSRGNIVVSRNPAGPYQRERVSPAQPATAAQCAAWDNMANVSRLWNLLEEEQWAAWERLAKGAHSRPKLGVSGPLSGCQLFKKLNRVLATCQREPLLDPPPLPEFGPNPVKGFEIRKVRGGYALILKIATKPPWAARPVAEDLMVYSWAPCNAGTRTNSLYSFLGLAPQPEEDESDFMEIYLRKLKDWRKLGHKRYRLPLPGSKVFVRVVQQINGWENELWAFQASALVPVNRELRASELAALLGKWPVRHPQQ